MDILKKVSNFYDGLMKSKLIYFLIGSAIICSYYILYLFRSVDNTVLMSWNQVFYFTGINIYKLLLILSVVIIISFIISRINIFNRYNEEKYHILLLFFSGVIIGSLFWNIPEINPDAARYMTEAKYLEEYGIQRFFIDWGHELFVFVDFPSIPFFYGIIFRYLGEYREYIQLFNTILFSLTSILTYKISKRLWDEEVGLYSGFLLLSFPYLLSQVPLMLIDIPLMFLTILSAFLIFKIFDNKYYSIPALLVVFFTIYSKMTSPLMIIPAISILLINYKYIIKNRSRWDFTLILSLASIILFLYWKYDVFIEQIRYMQNYSGPVFYESELNYLFQIGPITIFLALISILVAYLKKDKNFIILIAWIFLPFLMFHDSRIRYMIPVFPFIAIMSSISICAISNKDIKKFLIMSLALASIVFTLYAYIPFEENFTDKNIKNAAEFTNTINISEIQLILDFSEKHPYDPEPFVPLFDLYSHKKLIYSFENKFYPVKDFSNSWTALYKIPSFFINNKSSDSQIIVIISDKNNSNSLPSKYLEKHILVKRFENMTFSILNPSFVTIYQPRNTDVKKNSERIQIYESKYSDIQ